MIFAYLSIPCPDEISISNTFYHHYKGRQKNRRGYSMAKYHSYFKEGLNEWAFITSEVISCGPVQARFKLYSLPERMRRLACIHIN
jgi:hypothetical protein